jgi:hypothetical protein
MILFPTNQHPKMECCPVSEDHSLMAYTGHGSKLLTFYSRTGQLQPSGALHNFLRIHVSVAYVCVSVYVYGGRIALTKYCYLQPISYVKSMVE